MAKQKKAQEVSAVRQAKHAWIITLLFAVLSVFWISPILMVLLNSFKRKAYIFKHPFGISTVSISEGFDAFKDGMSRLFSGTLNYKNGLRMTHFWECFGTSLFITVGSVILIVLCCSMCAWYIVRVKTKGTKLMYTLCLFSMIVPFQMVMFTLSKFANMPENNGMLPVKVEWILEEFANMPPINDIHVSVSVARSRGMRYIFFIQSFAQLDQIYGKEIASIIIDNSALCYLKTNSVECAQIIEKKLGKATITTNSLSTSTDPFKVGGNQTTSLLGRELLTANEIISLKYKTIIFPVFGNPIFRDTYMYSDLYPKYKKVAICEREIKKHKAEKLPYRNII